MQTQAKFGALSSSVDPSQLSATVTGAIITASSLIVAVAGHFQLPLTVQEVSQYAGEIGTGIGAIWTLFGIGRKIVVAVQQRFFPTK